MDYLTYKRSEFLSSAIPFVVVVVLFGPVLGSTTPPTVVKTKVTAVVRNESLNVCSSNDTMSSTYCTCSPNVASCDFSSYPGSMDERTHLKLFLDKMDHAVKRLCIFGGPKYVMLNVTKSGTAAVINDFKFLHRVDVYNISGPLFIVEAFKYPFSGDFYMTNVSKFDALERQLERGSSDLFTIENVEELQCCSKIIVPQHYSKPVLFMENVFVDEVKQRAVSSEHVWRTVILNHLTVRKFEAQGIALNSMTEEVNVSITNCWFMNGDDQAITIKGFKNTLIAKNYFDPEFSTEGLIVKSDVTNSSLVIADNDFYNGAIWMFYGHNTLVWFNLFYFWDHFTFEDLFALHEIKGMFSIEYNTVDKFNFSFFPNDTLQDKVIFNENVLGVCNCSLLYETSLPNMMKKQLSRCDPYGDVHPSMKKPDEDCLLNYDAAKTTCKSEESELKFSHLCKQFGVMRPPISKKAAFESVALKTLESLGDSKFLVDLMKSLNFKFQMHHVFQHTRSDSHKDSQIANKNNSSHFALFTLLLLPIVFLLCGAFLIFKSRLQLRFGIFRTRRTESYDNMLSVST